MATNSKQRDFKPEEKPRIQVSWSWMLQRFTGILLLVFVGGHLWVEHFMNTTTNIVSLRLSHWIYSFLDLGLLVIVVYHGLNGLRSIIKEYMMTNYNVWIDVFLWILGIFTIIWGLDILWAFWYHHPFFIV